MLTSPRQSLADVTFLRSDSFKPLDGDDKEIETHTKLWRLMASYLPCSMWFPFVLSFTPANLKFAQINRRFSDPSPITWSTRWQAHDSI